MIRYALFPSIVLFLTLQCFADENSRRHHVAQGETLSILAQKYLGFPVYGKNGTLNQLLSVNASIVDPNQLAINSEIIIPGRSEAPARTISQEAPAVDAVITPPPVMPTVTRPQSSGYFAFGTRFGSLALYAKDASNGSRATLVSQSNYGFGFAVGQKYSDQLNGEYGVDIEKVHFERPTVGQVDYLNRTRFGFHLSGEYRASERHTISFGLPIIQTFFIAAVPGAQNYSVQKITTVAPFIGGDYSWFKSPVLESSLGVVGQIYFPSSNAELSAKTGFGYGPRAQVKQKVGQYKIESTLGYFVKNQSTNYTEQNDSTVLLTFRLFYNFDGVEESK